MSNVALMVQGTMPIGDVVMLGMGIVFIGLICIVILCVMMGKIVRILEKKDVTPAAPAVSAEPVAPAAPVEAIPNRGELVAAISCCLAEELGTDVSAIRILSLKKM